MRKIALLTSVASIGFMSDVCEVVLAKTKDGDTVRVNKSDFDADQGKPAGERQYSAAKGDVEQSNQSTTGLTYAELGVEPTAAPSAPDFSGGDTVTPTLIDPSKQAAAPSVPSPTDFLVMKEGSKFFVVNGLGVKIEAVGLDHENGYPSKVKAEEAIKSYPR